MEKFLKENLDILKEVGSIGMGHAATSLSHMLNMKITMSTPSVYIMKAKETEAFLKERDKATLGVILGLQGDARGRILQILSKKFALLIINYFFQNNLEDITDLDEMSFSVIQEIGNISSGAYCNSLAAMTNMFIDISTPTHCKDICAETGLTGKNPEETIIIITNSFFIGGEEIKSDFLFMPDEETIEMVIKKLMEYYGIKN